MALVYLHGCRYTLRMETIMLLHQLTYQFSLWISLYFAIISLLTLLVWRVRLYLIRSNHRQDVRDCTVFFLTVSVLILILHLHPIQFDVYFWQPITWFAFAMLMMFEILWFARLFGLLCQFLCIIPRQARMMLKPSCQEPQPMLDTATLATTYEIPDRLLPVTSQDPVHTATYLARRRVADGMSTND